MSFGLLERLQHIRLEAEFALAQREGLTSEQFKADEVLKRAIVRSLEIIGEAVKQIPPDFRRQYPQIPWRSIASMRDRLIHVYFSVDYDIVWDVVCNHLPELSEACRMGIQKLSDS